MVGARGERVPGVRRARPAPRAPLTCRVGRGAKRAPRHRERGWPLPPRRPPARREVGRCIVGVGEILHDASRVVSTARRRCRPSAGRLLAASLRTGRAASTASGAPWAYRVGLRSCERLLDEFERGLYLAVRAGLRVAWFGRCSVHGVGGACVTATVTLSPAFASPGRTSAMRSRRYMWTIVSS